MPLDTRYGDFFKQLTLDQIMVFGAVFRASEVRQSLADLSKQPGGRDISSYSRTITRLNDQSKRYFGEPLLYNPIRKGMHWTPTATGRMFYSLCEEISDMLAQNTRTIERVLLVRPVRIAMPQLPLMDMLRIEDAVNEQLRKLSSSRRFEKELIHIRSEHLPGILIDSPDIDFAFGGLINPQTLDTSLEFVEIERRRYNLIANFDLNKEYGIAEDAVITLEFLHRKVVPLIIAHIGVIVDCLLGTLGIIRNRKEHIGKYLSLIRDRYKIVEECNDVHFMIELLCTSRQHICMFGTRDIFQRAKDRAGSDDIASFWKTRKGTPPHIFYQPVTHDLPPLCVGVIRRRPSEEVGLTHARDHPCRLFWEAVQARAATSRSASSS